MLNTFRTTALTALISTAASTSQATERPMNSVKPSMRRDRDNRKGMVSPSNVQGCCQAAVMTRTGMAQDVGFYVRQAGSDA